MISAQKGGIKGDVNMFDFIEIKVKTSGNSKTVEIYPEFIANKSNDLMIRGNAFYAFWDENTGLWCKDEDILREYVDQMLLDKAKDLGMPAVVRLWREYSSGIQTRWKRYCKEITNKYKELDQKVIFSNVKTKKTDYASMKLSYPLEEGRMDAYEELISVLYSPKERAKIEWAIGSIIAGDSRELQKFYVFYGTAGSGKSTVLNIIQMLFSFATCIYFFKQEKMMGYRYE